MGHQTHRLHRQDGIALLGTMMIVLILSILGATVLNLAGQEAISAAAARDAGVAQQLADAVGEVAMAWFHDPQTIPSSAAPIFAKRNSSVSGAPSFFDQAGRSQFGGTAERPDFVLNATNLSDVRMLNDPQVGLFHAMSDLGSVEEFKVYAPTRPGLLCTVDVSVKSSRAIRQSVVMQLAALEVPPLRAAVQVGQQLGMLQTGTGSQVRVHWGDLRVSENLVLHRVDELPAKSMLAPITGKPYEEGPVREDRWMEAWIGGHVQILQPPPGPLTLPYNVHAQQNPVPGMKLDVWSYEQLKRIAKQHGTYFAIDREGQLYPQGRVEPGHGLSANDALQSSAVGDQRGLIFIDTLDQTAPREDNLGTVTIRAPYFEGVIVMQGHLVIAPEGTGQTLLALSPPQMEQQGGATRKSVQLSHIQVNGVLYAAGNIIVSGQTQLFGAVAAEGTIVPSKAGGVLEVWYNHDMSRGLYRGLPVVYRAPGTWIARY